MTSLFQTFSDSFQSHGTALTVPGSNPISFPELKQRIAKLQSTIASFGLDKGSAIAIVLPNSVEFALTFFAVTYSGYVAAPLNVALKPAEFEFYLADLQCPIAFVPADKSNGSVLGAAKKTGVKTFVVDTEANVRDLAGKPVTHGKVNVSSAQPDDVALVLHTSGTTGRPKIVPLTNNNLSVSIRNIVQTYKLTKSDVSMLVMPLFHVHGLLCGFLAPLSVGAGVIVPTRFHASTFWRDYEAHGATWYTAVPTIHQILLKSPIPSPVPSIRFIRSCSSALAPSTMRALEKVLHAPVVEAYAMTEASHQMTSNDLPPGKRKIGSVGRAQGDVAVKILDQAGTEVEQGHEGEICVKGGNVTTGYRNNDSANASSYTSSGFFRTGDQGKVDEDGFVFITGRIKELINRGGEKIAPLELDAVMLEHPDVSEAVSFGVPDEMYGQEVHAAIVLKPGAKVDEKSIQAFVGERVAKFKVPKRIFFVDTMPKTATGKIQRRNVGEYVSKMKRSSKL
ncbi:hypothetical protein V1512DRAFT_265449 [Lipomyces arxii]|uniref:uncharacterized protein n=1 Tax=Lipomyces arxii TaxID=56418 RepID=UPI0034CF2AFE